MTDQVMRGRRLAAVLAGAMAPLMLLVGLLLPVSLGETEAGWTDTTRARATATATTIPAATLTADCEYRSGLAGLGARVEIHWALPVGYTLEDAILMRSTEGALAILEPVLGFSFSQQTEENPNGTYTTTVPVGLLGGLIGGATLRAGVAVEDASGWVSETAVIEARLSILGIGTCENLTD